MSNIFEKIEHGVVVAAEDVEKAVVYLPKVVKVIDEAIKDEPEVKEAIQTLIQKATTVVGDVSTAAAAKGLNLQQDGQTLADAEAFFSYFKGTFIPQMIALGAVVKADLA